MSKPDGYQKGIPGVPLSALNAIQDQNTRQVLRAIVDGWHVRNGTSGEGDNRFITRAELKEVQGTVNNLFLNSSGSGGGAGKDKNILTSGEINRIITDLEASVMESLLWKELGTTINRIKVDTSQNAASIQNEVQQRINGDNAIVQQTNTQFTVINGNLGLLQQQYTTMSNNVSALAQSLTTLQADVGQNSIALQQEMTVRANADNDIYAKYSVKIDNNGYVSGFGLMSTSNNSVPFSDFIVRADRFAIGSPSGPGITPTVPFIVLTTPDAKGNQPGVYMRNAMIANAAIGAAQIDDLSVNTLKIAGNAITRTQLGQSSFSSVVFQTTPWAIEQPPDGSQSPVIYNPSYWSGLTSVDVFVPSNALSSGNPVRVALTYTGNLYPVDGSGASVVLGVAYSPSYGNITIIGQAGGTGAGGAGFSLTSVAYYELWTPGTHTFILGARLQAGPSGNWSPPGGKAYNGIGSLLVQSAFR